MAGGAGSHKNEIVTGRTDSLGKYVKKRLYRDWIEGMYENDCPGLLSEI